MRGGQDNNQIKEVNKALDIALDEAFGANEVLVCNRLALAAYALVTHIARATPTGRPTVLRKSNRWRVVLHMIYERHEQIVSSVLATRNGTKRKS